MGSRTTAACLSDGSVTDIVTHVCEGTTDRNGFYGEGIVNAARAARW